MGKMGNEYNILVGNIYCRPRDRYWDNIKIGPSNASGGWSPTSRRRGRGSIPGQYTWNLWWTEWHWDRIFTEYFGYSVSM